MTHEATRLAEARAKIAKAIRKAEGQGCQSWLSTDALREAIKAIDALAALAQPAPTAEVALPAVSEEADFEVRVQYDEDSMGVASTSGPRDRALAEAMNYARQYLEEGPVEVFEVVRTSIAKLEFRAQSAAKGDAP